MFGQPFRANIVRVFADVGQARSYLVRQRLIWAMLGHTLHVRDRMWPLAPALTRLWPSAQVWSSSADFSQIRR